MFYDKTETAFVVFGVFLVGFMIAFAI